MDNRTYSTYSVLHCATLSKGQQSSTETLVAKEGVGSISRKQPGWDKEFQYVACPLYVDVISSCCLQRLQYFLPMKLSTNTSYKGYQKLPCGLVQPLTAIIWHTPIAL